MRFHGHLMRFRRTAATNEPQTGDVEAACSGQIGMAETRDNSAASTTGSWRRRRTIGLTDY